MLHDLIRRAALGNPTLAAVEAAIQAQTQRSMALSRRTSRVIANWSLDPKRAKRLSDTLRVRLAESRKAELRMHKLFMMLV